MHDCMLLWWPGPWSFKLRTSFNWLLAINSSQSKYLSNKYLVWYHSILLTILNPLLLVDASDRSEVGRLRLSSFKYELSQMVLLIAKWPSFTGILHSKKQGQIEEKWWFLFIEHRHKEIWKTFICSCFIFESSCLNDTGNTWPMPIPHVRKIFSLDT